jgi:hypothetical protein
VIRNSYQFFASAALLCSLVLLPAFGKHIVHFISSFADAFLLYEQTCVVALLAILHQANLLPYSEFSLPHIAARPRLVSWHLDSHGYDVVMNVVDSVGK